MSKFLYITFLSTLLLNPLLLSQCSGCNAYFNNLSCESYVQNIEDCNAADIQFLQELISINNLTEDSSISDKDNGDGFFSPLEIGKSRWEDGRLVMFNTLLADNSPWGVEFFYYELLIIPDALSNITEIAILILGTSGIQSLPDSIGSLTELGNLILVDNEFIYLPQDICLLNLDWENGSFLGLEYNYICAIIPECTEDFLGVQLCGWHYPGDLNDDDAIDISDIILSVNYILWHSGLDRFQVANADLDENRIVNIQDIIIIVNIIIS